MSFHLAKQGCSESCYGLTLNLFDFVVKGKFSFRKLRYCPKQTVIQNVDMLFQLLLTK